MLLVVQAFYLLDSWMYRDFVKEPERDEVIWGENATSEGCRSILKALESQRKVSERVYRAGLKG